jgi:hypothetical protein
VFCCVLTAAYWGVFALFSDVGVSPVAHWLLYAGCLSSWWWVRARGLAAGTTAPLSWLSYAGQAVVLALLFYGGNAARDVLFGPDRPRAVAPEWLGGLELWWLLCPGATSVALAAAAVQVVDRARQRSTRNPG